jgi:predicted Kef-type K+ transport protein
LRQSPARRLGLPAVVGYLVLGLAVSPFTPGYVADRHQLQLLADVGVVLLLFEVGIEVDLWRLRREHGQIMWAAPVQVLTTHARRGGSSCRSATCSPCCSSSPLAMIAAVAVSIGASTIIVRLVRVPAEITPAA